MDDDAECKTEARHYLALAAGYARPHTRALIIMHGLSGSGKSVCAGQSVELLGALQIRSDVERKRMHGLASASDAGAAPGGGIYQQAASAAVYRRLLELARTVVAAGKSVIVDAAFLHAAQRHEFHALADELQVPFFIFDLRAPDATLRARIAARRARGGDASDAGLDVLDYQLRTAEPLTAEESTHALAIDTEAGIEAVQAACDTVKKASSD